MTNAWACCDRSDVFHAKYRWQVESMTIQVANLENPARLLRLTWYELPVRSEAYTKETHTSSLEEVEVETSDDVVLTVPQIHTEATQPVAIPSRSGVQKPDGSRFLGDPECSTMLALRTARVHTCVTWTRNRTIPFFIGCGREAWEWSSLWNSDAPETG